MMAEAGVYVGVTAGRLPHGAPLSSRVAAGRALLALDGAVSPRSGAPWRRAAAVRPASTSRAAPGALQKVAGKITPVGGCWRSGVFSRWRFGLARDQTASE